MGIPGQTLEHPWPERVMATKVAGKEVNGSRYLHVRRRIGGGPTRFCRITFVPRSWSVLNPTLETLLLVHKAGTE